MLIRLELMSGKDNNEKKSGNIERWDFCDEYTVDPDIGVFNTGTCFCLNCKKTCVCVVVYGWFDPA